MLLKREGGHCRFKINESLSSAILFGSREDFVGEFLCNLQATSESQLSDSLSFPSSPFCLPFADM